MSQPCGLPAGRSVSRRWWMGRRNDGVSPPAIIVFSRSSEGLKYESRKTHAKPTANTVAPARTRLIRERSAIAAASRAPGDAQRVEEHPRRVPREADRRLLVVDEPERLAADPTARLLRAQQDLGLEGEGGDVEASEEPLRHRRPVPLVAALRVREVEAGEALHHPRVDDARELADGRHLGGAHRVRVEAVTDHDVGAVPEPGERGRERVEGEREVGIGEDDELAAGARHAALDRPALAEVL